MAMPSSRSSSRADRSASSSRGRQRRGRLVEDQDARLADRAPWRSRPSAAGRAGAPRPASTSGSFEADQRRRRPSPVAPAPDSRSRPKRLRIGAEADILGDREARPSGSAPAARRRCRRGAPPRASCVRRGLPSISIVPPSGCSAPDRRLISVDLPGAVLAEQRVDAARQERDRDVAQHGVAEE